MALPNLNQTAIEEDQFDSLLSTIQDNRERLQKSMRNGMLRQAHLTKVGNILTVIELTKLRNIQDEIVNTLKKGNDSILKALSKETSIIQDENDLLNKTLEAFKDKEARQDVQESLDDPTPIKKKEEEKSDLFFERLQKNVNKLAPNKLGLIAAALGGSAALLAFWPDFVRGWIINPIIDVLEGSRETTLGKITGFFSDISNWIGKTFGEEFGTGSKVFFALGALYVALNRFKTLIFAEGLIRNITMLGLKLPVVGNAMAALGATGGPLFAFAAGVTAVGAALYAIKKILEWLRETNVKSEVQKSMDAQVAYQKAEADNNIVEMDKIASEQRQRLARLRETTLNGIEAITGPIKEILAESAKRAEAERDRLIGKVKETGEASRDLTSQIINQTKKAVNDKLAQIDQKLSQRDQESAVESIVSNQITNVMKSVEGLPQDQIDKIMKSLEISIGERLSKSGLNRDVIKDSQAFISELSTMNKQQIEEAVKNLQNAPKGFDYNDEGVILQEPVTGDKVNSESKKASTSVNNIIAPISNSVDGRDQKVVNNNVTNNSYNYQYYMDNKADGQATGGFLM